MALSIDRIVPLRLMKAKLFYPTAKINDKFHDSVVFIMAKSVDDTISFLKNNTFLVNNGYFTSYYTEKDFKFILQEAYKYEKNIQTMLESDNGQHDVLLNDYFIKNEKSKLFYPDSVDDIIFKEDFGITQNYSNIFRKLLYEKRITNQKEIMDFYDTVKSKVPFIKHTYPQLHLYRRRNLIIDWSYYTEAFMKNNYLHMDKGIDLFHHFLTHFIIDKRLKSIGYTRKTLFIPVDSWSKNISGNIWDYTKNINPISMIYRLIKMKKNLAKDWTGISFFFVNKNGYFTVDFNDLTQLDLPKFTQLINKLRYDEMSNAGEELVVSKLTGDIKDTDDGSNKDSDIISVQVGGDIPEDDGGIDDVEMQQIKSAIDNINTTAKSNTPVINKTRKERMEKLNKEFRESTFDGKKVKDILNTYYNAPEELKKDTIPIDSLNKEWNDITFTNFDKEYNLDNDVLAILNTLLSKSHPISIVSLTKEDSSTYENYTETYHVKIEDAKGTRSELVFELPKFIDNRFMKLGGNIKTLNGQLILMPIIKTAEDTAQIVSSYNKIFIRRVSPMNGSKTTKFVNRLTKTLNKYPEDGKLKIFAGDSSFIMSKYVIPMEFRDLGGLYSIIKCKDGSYISFNIDKNKELEKKIDSKYNPKTDMIIGYDASTKKTLYAHNEYIAKTIVEFLCSKDDKFKEIFDGTKASDKLAYSEASILSSRIPVIIVMAFSEGLQKAMTKGKVKYQISEKRPKADDTHSVIRFKDGFIIYEDSDPKASLLMSGLSLVDTENYSIGDMDNKDMWVDVLDDFGGRLKADGLNNFYDCMFDPMTIDVCKRYNLPYDYVEALAYASGLLADTEYNKHTDISGNRMRTNELIAGYLYKSITKAYATYANQMRHTGKAKLTMKPNEVISNIMQDQGCSDLSILNPLLEAEAAKTLSFKGLSGMNSDRSYQLDKRTYDKSMLGVIGMSTGFAANVGITRQASINSSIRDTRGTIETPKDDKLNTLNMLTVYEGLTPYGTTHDDPMRTAMGFIQTTKHQMRVKKSSPNLITYGTDEALPYMTSNVFSYKFKGKKGKVIDVTDDLIIYKNLDDNTIHSVSLKEEVMKNSDGGFYVTVKLSPIVKKGDILKYNDILAYDKSSYSKANASSKDQKNISYNIGTLAKIAIMCTDEAYEDASIINERLSDALTSEYCVCKNKSFKADTNVYNIVKKGQEIKEGDSLIVFQNAFDDKDANALLKNLADDEVDMMNDFGRIKIRSKITGVVQDVRIYRTCDIKDLSPSLKKIVTEYESGIKKQIDKLKKYGLSDEEIKQKVEPNYKLPQEGKLKITPEGVMIEFYIKCVDKMGIGDKLVYNTAIKGTIKSMMPSGEEPYTDFRKDEPVDALLTSASVNARMAVSIITSGVLNKLLIEATRKCKDILGIPWENLNNK